MVTATHGGTGAGEAAQSENACPSCVSLGSSPELPKAKGKHPQTQSNLLRGRSAGFPGCMCCELCITTGKLQNSWGVCGTCVAWIH